MAEHESEKRPATEAIGEADAKDALAAPDAKVEPKAPSSPPVEAAAKHPSSRPIEAAKPASVPPPAPREPDPEPTPAIDESAEEAITAADAPVAVAVAPKAAFPSSPPPSGRASVKTKAKTAAPAAGGPLAAYEALATSARLPELVAIGQKILGDAASARRSGWDFTAKVTAAADDAKLARADAETPFGNALSVLGAGPETEPERALASALWAHVIAEGRRDDDSRLAGDILWLATHTAFDATALLDRALGDDADDLWAAIGDRVRRIDEGKGTALGRGEAIVGCAALAASESVAARRIATELAPRTKDPTLARLLGAATPAPVHEVRLEGEAVSAPRSYFATAVLALTGILFVMHAARLIARLALAYRKPAELSLSDAGVRMKSRTEMLGRTLREHEHVIVRAGLVRVVREVRYPRAGFYAGLFALALGSYIGVRAFSDGVRSASPSLLLTGLIVVALGIGADFVMGSLLPGTRGRVRIMFIPKAGKSLCLADVDATRADAALTSALTAPK